MQEKPEALYVPAGHSVYVDGGKNGGNQSFRDREARKKNCSQRAYAWSAPRRTLAEIAFTVAVPAAEAG